MKNKPFVIKKVEKSTCWSCGGRGCKACQFTGKWSETHFIVSDGKNAVDSDTGG